MISAWHLLWIVPLSAFFGLMTSALCVASHNRDNFGGNIHD